MITRAATTNSPSRLAHGSRMPILRCGYHVQFSLIDPLPSAMFIGPSNITSCGCTPICSAAIRASISATTIGAPRASARTPTPIGADSATPRVSWLRPALQSLPRPDSKRSMVRATQSGCGQTSNSRGHGVCQGVGEGVTVVSHVGDGVTGVAVGVGVAVAGRKHSTWPPTHPHPTCASAAGEAAHSIWYPTQPQPTRANWAPLGGGGAVGRCRGRPAHIPRAAASECGQTWTDFGMPNGKALMLVPNAHDTEDEPSGEKVEEGGTYGGNGKLQCGCIQPPAFPQS